MRKWSDSHMIKIGKMGPSEKYLKFKKLGKGSKKMIQRGKPRNMS